MMTASTPQQRLSANERREAALHAAIVEFARHGYASGSTEAISRAVGISQPYLFKLFGTKKALFLAAYDRVWAEIDTVLEAAAVAHPTTPLEAMSAAFQQLCQQRDYMLLTLQAYAAASDEEIRAAIQQRETTAFAETVTLTGARPAEVRRFFADGYLMIVGAALDIPAYLG